MKKTLFLSLVFFALLALLSACAAPYRGDVRVGEYTSLGADSKTVVYRLTLNEDGTGTFIHYPTIGGETKEEIFFTFDEDVLRLHGTEVVGGVIGRNEFYGTLFLASDHSPDAGNRAVVYEVELFASQSGVALGNFVQER